MRIRLCGLVGTRRGESLGTASLGQRWGCKVLPSATTKQDLMILRMFSIRLSPKLMQRFASGEVEQSSGCKGNLFSRGPPPGVFSPPRDQ